VGPNRHDSAQGQEACQDDLNFSDSLLCRYRHNAHWTGHPSRLDRDLAHPFGSVGYAKEELRAEIASLMIGDWLGIGHDPGQHAAYVKSWVQVLKEDPKEILRASRGADMITGYLLGLEKERLPTNMEKLTQVERPAAPEKAERQPAPRRVRAASGRDR
jgi:antirestriction protein ArdC